MHTAALHLHFTKWYGTDPLIFLPSRLCQNVSDDLITIPWSRGGVTLSLQLHPSARLLLVDLCTHIFGLATAAKMASVQSQKGGDLFAYLSPLELSRLDERFEAVLQDATCLVFWTGLDRSLVQRWTDKHGLKTLVSVMGALFEPLHPDSARLGKNKKRWSRYIKEASGRFAQHACRGRRAIILTNPPPEFENPIHLPTSRLACRLVHAVVTGVLGNSSIS